MRSGGSERYCSRTASWMRGNTRRILPSATSRITGGDALLIFIYGNWRMRRLCTACQLAGQPLSARAERLRGEESPGSTEKRCRITSGGGDPRESATERIPPAFGQVRVKGWGKSPPRAWQHGWQGKPHREQDRIGMTWTAQAARPFPGQSSGWVAGGSAQALSQMNGCHVPAFGPEPYRTRLTGQLANSPLLDPGQREFKNRVSA